MGVGPHYSLEVKIPFTAEEIDERGGDTCELGEERALAIINSINNVELIFDKPYDKYVKAFKNREGKIKWRGVVLEVRYMGCQCEYVGNTGDTALVISHRVYYDEPLETSSEAIAALLRLKKFLAERLGHEVQDYASAHTI
jgi:hypothetical protein|tara:strand:+ start:931 stop:1353 length:423 start_codon:yes stop_codon:yes gene_type:complete